MSSKTEKVMVAAIDLGTNYSGYACSFKHDYEKDPTKVITFQNSQQLSSFGCPTCVLCNPKGEFHSFGYDAEDKYSELAENKEQHKWYFFRRFKMALHEKQVNSGFDLVDDKGLKMPARKIFAMAIRYLKDHLLQLLETFGTGLRADDIHWVLPVPTTWTVSLKEFFREAANEAGIDKAFLTIVLESKAAAMYCQPHFNTGAKYVVIDLGDERVNITILNNESDGTIKVGYTTSDKSIGGGKVVDAYNQIFIELMGAQTFKKFCDENRDDYMEMLREFKMKRRTICADTKEKVVIKVPMSLYEKFKGRIKDAIEQSCYRGKIIIVPGRLRLEADLLRSLFHKTINEIIKHVSDCLAKTGAKESASLLMIGGFSDCRLMQEAMRMAFPHNKVIIPNVAFSAVLIGAVIFGHRSGLRSKQDNDDISTDVIANVSMCSATYQQGSHHDEARNMKYKSLSEEVEEYLSSDFLEMNMRGEDKSNPALETQLEHQTTLKADFKRAPSDDELFTLSRKLDKLNKGWWLLAKLLGLSDEKIDEIEHGGGDTVRQYYKMLTGWKKQNADQIKGSVGYLLRQCDEADIDREVTVSVFGN